MSALLAVDAGQDGTRARLLADDCTVLSYAAFLTRDPERIRRWFRGLFSEARR